MTSTIAPTTTPSPIVLVIETDALVRVTVSAYLRHCGFKVIEAVNTEEALTVLKTDVQVTVVFSDMGQAGDGFNLARWIRRERPNIKIILSSGLKRSAEEAGKLCEEGPHLKQPYDHVLLERRLRQLIATRRD